ncbi:Hypothetical predicted protein [Paramuricea clavata]|uniref:Uncharacterized protein n=1 Tax=Paramuricea clavata TaxID=317549 RepID=A0A6S7HYC2_PARCT|nr:Hypothetical predicted protein [Paramuricea clavata]
MSEVLTEHQNEDNVDSVNPEISHINTQENFPDLKKGIKLPKSPLQWSTANDFFKLTFSNLPITPRDLNNNINTMATVVYNYFSENFGYVNNHNDKLKLENGDILEIKFVAKKLRNLLNKSNTTDPNNTDSHASANIDHDSLIGKSFWGFVKQFFKKNTSSFPSFNLAECTSYFTKTLSAISPTKTFNIPSWIPKFASPQTPFNLDPPTYQEITNVIRKMKPSGSPCPLDQISIICFKRCPYLRSYLTVIIHAAWSCGVVPSEWKKACTILIHKKGETANPANFRPITLESVPLKVFTSCLRNRTFQFLAENNYIEQNLQKGFTPKLSGTLEHTAQLAHIINKARVKQRSLIITLLDLKNAFGEVHHNLIYEVLQYHHIPDHIKNLVSSLYTDFQTSIITEQFNTSFITVGRGVLQGDCLSPLLFNMSFNTFIQHIKSEKYRQLGFWKSSENGTPLNPLHWFQFADDAAVVSGQEKENQMLLNRFTIWCQWAQMIIRVDKCSTFGIRKQVTKSIQYLPKLFINNCLVPRVELVVMCFPKSLGTFTVSDIGKTWVNDKLDSIASTYIRKWLELPISATLSNVLLPHNKFGLNIILPSTKFLQCQTVSRKALKSSPNQAINNLWKDTSNHKNVQYDKYKNTKDVLNTIRKQHEDKLQHHLISQGSFFSNIIKHSTLSFNSIWSSVQSKLPKNIFNFTIRYINNTLPTRKNLLKWGISPTSECSFCLNPESLLHVVAGCKTYLNEGRFTWRHDSVLNFIASILKSVNHCNLYADLPGYISPSVITGDELRPDLLITLENKCIYILELTVGFESNLLTNATRKRQKYQDLINEQLKNYEKVKFVNLSISSLGVFSHPSLDFTEMLKDLKFDEQCRKYYVRKIINICIRSSYYIFCKRNKEWDNPQLMSY